MKNRIFLGLIAILAIMVLVVGSAWPQGLGVSKAQTNLSEEQIFTGDIVAPSPRDDHAMAYDAARQRVVLFGGRASGRLLGDTWEWDGESWTQKFPASGPSARAQHAMAYDAARQRVVLFGGYSDPSREFHDLNDTWEWDGVNWSRKSPTNSPPARAEHALAYDEAHQRVVLFGGSSFNDTWEWDGTTWTQKFPQVSPSARLAHAMVYDAARQRVVLFGGDRGGRPWLNDTWEWDGLTWTQKHPAVSPPGLNDSGMAYDPARSRVVLFGGDYQVGSNATWEWNGTTWTQMSPTVSPPARYQLAAAYDGHYVVIFGGSDGRNYLDDTWQWDGRTWVRVGRQQPLPFLDNFDDGNADGWTEEGSGQWAVVGGVYTLQIPQSNVGATSSAGDSRWQDYTFEVDAVTYQGEDRCIYFRFQSPANHYSVDIRNGYGDLTLSKHLNGVWHPLQVVPFSGANNQWCHEKIEVQGNRIRVWVDGRLYLTYTDTDHPHQQGKIALGAWSGSRPQWRGAFDNVEVRGLEPPAELSFGYVGAIQSVRGAPLIVNKETAIEVDLVKRGGPAVQGIQVSVLANDQICYFFYVKEEATAETKWQLTQLHNTLDLPEGDCQRTLYFFAPERRLVPTQAGVEAYDIAAHITAPGVGPVNFSDTLEVLDPKWGWLSPQLKILCIPADWELLGKDKGNRITKTTSEMEPFFQSTFPVADEGYSRLVVVNQSTEASTKGRPLLWPLTWSWPDVNAQLGKKAAGAWLASQSVVWRIRLSSVDRLLFITPEDWADKRGGPELGHAPGLTPSFKFAQSATMAEARERYQAYDSSGNLITTTLYSGNTPGFLTVHELGHTFGLQDRGGLTPNELQNALDVRNKRVEAHREERNVADLMYGFPITSTGKYYAEDRWLVQEDYASIALAATQRPSSVSAGFVAQQNRALLISAIVYEDGRADLQPWYLLNEAEVDVDLLPVGSEYFLEYLNERGQVIYSRGFADLMRLYDEPWEFMPLAFTAPYVEGLREVRLRHGQQLIFNRTVSTHSPTVRITNPVSGVVLADEVNIAWVASDPDGESPLCSLTAYREDIDEILPLADGLGSSSYRWSTEKLSPGWYRLEALVTDGVNTAKTSVRVLKMGKTYFPLILNPPRPTPTPTATPTPTSTPRPTVTPLPTATPSVQNVGRVWGHVYDRQTGRPRQGITICLGSTDGRDAWGGRCTSDVDGAFKFWWLPIDPVAGFDCAVWICNGTQCLTQVHLTLQSPERGNLDFWVDEAGNCQ